MVIWITQMTQNKRTKFWSSRNSPRLLFTTLLTISTPLETWNKLGQYSNWAMGWTSGVQFPAGIVTLFSSSLHLDWLCSPPHLLSMGARGFTWGKMARVWSWPFTSNGVFNKPQGQLHPTFNLYFHSFINIISIFQMLSITSMMTWQFSVFNYYL